MRLLGHWLAIRKASGEGALSVMVFEDGLTLDPEFRALIETSELPGGWGILVMEKMARTSSGGFEGWASKERLEPVGAYVIRRSFFRKVMSEIARKIRIGDCLGEMAEVFTSIEDHFQTVVWRGSLVRVKQGRSPNLMEWMTEFREARMFSMSMRDLPPFGERRRVIEEFGVDVFADAFHNYMRTGKAPGNE